MKQVRLIGLAFASVLLLSAFSAASAFAEAPEVRQKGGAEIPEKTEVVAESVAKTEPELKESGAVVKCEKVASTKGEVLGKTGKSITIVLVFKKCKEAETGAECTSEQAEQPKGSITTPLLLITLLKKGATTSGGFAFARNAKGGNTEELATFKCGTKTVKVTGCVGAEIKLNGESTMLEGKSLAKTEAEEPNGTKFSCEARAFGLKAEQAFSVAQSFNEFLRLMPLELT